MVLPLSEFNSDTFEVIKAEALPTKTYKLDFEKGRCGGQIEGLEAMEQVIFKVLKTIRFAHLIYSDDYGFENMIGHERLFVQAELPRRIKESLLQDERITSLENMELSFEKDEAYVSFTAITIYGDVKVLREVMTIV